MTVRTWQTNADEFALLRKGEGWPFAVLVACSVERGGSAATGTAKVSAYEFGQRARTAHTRVLRYLAAWEAAADAGLAPHADTLEPGDVPSTALPSAEWGTFYRPTLHRNREYARRTKADADALGMPGDSGPLLRAERLVNRAAQLIAEARLVAALTETEEQRVQGMALRLLESLDQKTVADAIAALAPNQPAVG